MPVLRAPDSFSKRLWGLDWTTILPWQLDEISVEAGRFDEALPFIEEHYARIFGADADAGRFLPSKMTGAKRRFCDEADVFLLRAPHGSEARTVGIFLSHPSDWATYYMRTAALLPEYRGRGLVARLMERLCEPLRAVGVERLEGDVSPANTPMMRLHVGQGFLVTSTGSSERWGALVRFTRFLSKDADGVFRRQFCNTPPLASPSARGSGLAQERSPS